MTDRRRRHNPEFKARAVFEALEGVKTIQQIAKKFDSPGAGFGARIQAANAIG